MNASKVYASLAGLLGMTVLLTGCGPKTGNGPVAPAVVAGVAVKTVRLQNWPEEYDAVGTIRSATSSVLGAQMSGVVGEIRIKPGDRVERGEVLAVIDDRGPRAQLASAEAGVAASKAGLAEVENALQAASAQRKLAEVTYHRYQELFDKNSASRQELDGAEAAYKAAVANQAAVAARKQQMEARGQEALSELELAQTTFIHSRIVSPIDGLVTAKFLDSGTLVMPGTPVLTVEDATHCRLEASLPQEMLPKIRLEEPVQVTTEAGQFPGRVVEVVPAADPATRTFVVKVALPAGCACRSGQYGKASFPVGEVKALAIPRSTLVERGQLEGVFVVSSNGLAEYRLVKTGKTLDDRVEILSGLSDGEQVAISQLDRLSDGVRVEAQ